MSVMLNHSSESSNEIRMIPICGIPKPMFILTVWNLNPCHSTVGTKVAIETTDYTFVVLKRSVQLPLPFPHFCNGINPKPCGNPFIFLFIHCVIPNPGLIPHINFFLIVFVVNCLRGGGGFVRNCVRGITSGESTSTNLKCFFSSVVEVLCSSSTSNDWL